MPEKLTLSELNSLIKDALMDAFPETVWVVAEISELKENRIGHCYLELIEKDSLSNETLARTRATIWSYTYRMLKPYFETTTGKTFSSGLKVLVQATIEFHEAYGLSLNIKDIDPTYTIGDLSLKKMEILERLHNDGIFDMNKELPLPFVPQRIAVISSATAAGYQDFVEQLENNSNGFIFHHKLFEAFMQGNSAVPSIIAALEKIFELEDFFDAVVIIRGGGAQADLSCFDDYDLAYFVTQFPIPVITGIGHEKDEVIVDLVAHTRMKTPTAVAEFLISGVLRYYEYILGIETKIIQETRDIIEEEKGLLERIASRINAEGQLFLASKKWHLNNTGHAFESVINKYSYQKVKQLDEMENTVKFVSKSYLAAKGKEILSAFHKMKYGVGHLIQKEKNGLSNVCLALKNDFQIFISNESNRLALDEKAIQLLDPVKILQRGFTLTLKNGKIVKSKYGLKQGDVLETKFSDGNVKSKIEKI